MTEVSTKIVKRQPQIPELWGLIPMWLTIHSDKPLWQQIDENYAHGGGWSENTKFKVMDRGDAPWSVKFPGDPVMHEQDRIQIDNEILIMFPYGYVLWTDGEDTKIARID